MSGDEAGRKRDAEAEVRDDRTLSPDVLTARYEGVKRRSNRIELPSTQWEGLVTDEGRWGVGALVRRDGAALLVREDSKDSEWVLPGGKLEVGESHAEGALREVREETGIDVEIDGLLAVSEQTFVDAADGREFDYFFATFGASPVAAGHPVPDDDPGLPEETIAEVRWHDTAPEDVLDRDQLVDLMGW
ncbi:NUDIX domain-containing protein [Halomarina rubra]|uniref:NUDIX domain-containing protein n=1 Tax=Halomarina rubra TaxID=2071873 RepID=A0ABD6AZD7_9EURY